MKNENYQDRKNIEIIRKVNKNRSMVPAVDAVYFNVIS